MVQIKGQEPSEWGLRWVEAVRDMTRVVRDQMVNWDNWKILSS